jgi:hypothetical protein
MTLSLPQPTLVGDEIDERLFGGNLVFSQDSVTGTFPARAEAAGLELIRFPGGSVTEAFFDPANPDAQSASYVNDLGQTITLTLVPLSDFLDYAIEADLGAIIVVPIQRYVNAWKAEGETRDTILTQADEIAIRDYVTTVLQSGVPIHAIEIGNEPCLCGVTDADYGKIADEMARVIHDAAEEFQAAGNLPEGYVHPLLSLVTTPYFFTADINGDGIATHEESLQERFAQLTPEALGNIDAITIHRYVSRDYEAIDNFQAPWIKAEQVDALVGRDLELIVTEWNISATQNGVLHWASATEAEREGLDTGLKHAGAVAAMFHEMAVNSVEVAAFWAVQQKNDVSLAQREGTNTELRPGGKMFSYLSENTQGLRAIDLDRPSPDFDLHAFGSNARQFLVINARLGEAQTIELDLTRFSGTVKSGWVQILTAAEGQDPRDPNVDTEIEDVPLAEAFDAGVLSLTLDPWEVAFVSLDLDASDDDNGQPPDEDDGADDDDEPRDDEDGETGGTCFVATCAYGNANHPDVAYLRLYRDRVLSQTVVGHRFISLYYRFGPYLAQWMAPYPRLKQITKLALSLFVQHHRERMAARTKA